MVASAIWEKTCTSDVFKDDQNCTNPKDECNLKSLKTHECVVFQILRETELLLITNMLNSNHLFNISIVIVNSCSLFPNLGANNWRTRTVLRSCR